MYKSKTKISTESKQTLLKKVNLFLEKNKFIYCKSLKRKINLSRLPDIILNREASGNSRLRTFFVVMDVLKKEKLYSQRINKGIKEYD